MEREHRRKLWDRLVHASLRSQLRLFLIIYAIMTILIVVHLVQDGVNPGWAVGGFIIGAAIGYILKRTKVLGWNATDKVVVGTTDIVGVLILIAYMVFLVFRTKIISAEVHNASAVAIVGLSITAGAMISRVYFTRRGIRNVITSALSGGHEPGP